MSIIGDLVRYYRKELKMSQEDLAKGICDRRSIINIENGKNTPELETIAILSERLRVNLFGAYASVHADNDLQTHLLCKEIDDALSHHDTKRISELKEKAEELPGFKKGVPKQLLYYVSGLTEYYAKNYEEASQIYKEGIRLRHPEFPEKVFDNTTYNNKEYAMMIGYAIALSMCGKKDESLDLLNQEEKHVAGLLDLNDYLDEGSKDFLNSIRCNCIYNTYCIDSNLDVSYVERITEAIEKQKNTCRVYLLSDLLFCKAALLMKSNDIEKAKETFNTAMVLGEFYNGKEYTKNRAADIINVRSSQSK